MGNDFADFILFMMMSLISFTIDSAIAIGSDGCFCILSHPFIHMNSVQHGSLKRALTLYNRISVTSNLRGTLP